MALDLRWARSADGCWFAHGTEQRPKRALTDIDGLDLYVVAGLQSELDRSPSEPIEPLRQRPGLFRTFAHLPTEDLLKAAEAATLFADRYGLLCSRPHEAPVFFVDEPLELPDPHNTIRLEAARGEPLSDWRTAIEQMAAVLRLWDLVQENDLDGLKQLVYWDDSTPRAARGVAFAEPYKGRLHVSGLWEDAEPWQLDALYPSLERQPIAVGDLVRPAVKYIQRTINLHVSEVTTTALLWDDEKSALELRVVPRSLLVGLWLQFAAAVAANARFRKCDAPGCDQWFEVTPPATRKTRLFCSEACRVRAHRARRAPAGEASVQQRASVTKRAHSSPRRRTP